MYSSEEWRIFDCCFFFFFFKTCILYPNINKPTIPIVYMSSRWSINYKSQRGDGETSWLTTLAFDWCLLWRIEHLDQERLGDWEPTSVKFQHRLGVAVCELKPWYISSSLYWEFAFYILNSLCTSFVASCYALLVWSFYVPRLTILPNCWNRLYIAEVFWVEGYVRVH